MMWAAYLRGLLLSLRVVVFEKPETAVTLLWSGPALLAVLVMLMYSVQAALVTSAVMLLALAALRRWARTNRYRLVRTGDRIEFADVTAPDEGYVQRFASGVVLRRMTKEDVVRSGAYEAERMEPEKRFFLVRTPEKTMIVALAWIVGIELEEG
jgi:hypothetical protein